MVDDEGILLLSMRQELRLTFGGDFIYETALSAEDGMFTIDKLIAQGVDVALVISDWLMPGMSGDVFLKKVHQKYPEIKLIMLSGHADYSQMEHLAEEAGLFAFIQKPYKSAQLSDLVQQALDH